MVEPGYNLKCPECNCLVGFSRTYYVVALVLVVTLLNHYAAISQQVKVSIVLMSPVMVFILFKVLCKPYVKNI